MRTAILLLVLAGPAHAGLYFADVQPPPPRAVAIRSDILQLRGAAAPPPGPLDQDSPRARLETIVRRIETVRAEGVCSTPDRVSLSAAYVRLGRHNDAIRLLTQPGSDQTHFLVLANLATAYFLNGDLEMAGRTQDKLLRAWPAVAPHWTADDLARCRVAELAFERLIRNRLAESRRGVTHELLPMDPIFPGFVVETPDGDYEPGEIPQAARDRLPADADRTLMQLLIWLPTDQRLYWQLGELSAAMGQVELGATILHDVFSAGQEYKGLRRHRKVLIESAELLRQLKPVEPAYQLRSVGLLITASLAPSGASLHVLAPSALTAPLMVRYFKRDDVQPPIDGGTPPERPLPFNMRHIAVSFAFGFLVAALIGFQFQEWRRRTARAEGQGAARAAEGKSDDGGHSRSTAPPAGP